MAGSYPQYSDPTPDQPTHSEPYPSYPFPAHQTPAQGHYQPTASPAYPGMLAPPVQYPRRRRWKLVAAIVLVLVLVVVGGATAAVFYALNDDSADGSARGGFTPAAAMTAIQSYLDALSTGDTDTVARNTLCGMYDVVRDQRADRSLAKLASDAFRKQFSSAQVTSVDKMVFLSSNQANVLFTMQVSPVSRSSRSTEEQAIAQLLYQDNQVLVCQYLIRTAGQY